MKQAVVNLDENTDRVLNVVKALHGFKRKDEALNYVVAEYGQTLIEREIRPEYLKKLEKIRKTKAVPVPDFGKRYGLT